jgi:hypothetical protein
MAATCVLRELPQDTFDAMQAIMAGAREHPDRQKLEDAVQQLIPKLTRKWCPGALPSGQHATSKF